MSPVERAAEDGTKKIPRSDKFHYGQIVSNEIRLFGMNSLAYYMNLWMESHSLSLHYLPAWCSSCVVREVTRTKSDGTILAGFKQLLWWFFVWLASRDLFALCFLFFRLFASRWTRRIIHDTSDNKTDMDYSSHAHLICVMYLSSCWMLFVNSFSGHFQCQIARITSVLHLWLYVLSSSEKMLHGHVNGHNDEWWMNECHHIWQRFW